MYVTKIPSYNYIHIKIREYIHLSNGKSHIFKGHLIFKLPSNFISLKKTIF